jgi:flagellar hook-associated protein 3 FlgL
MVRLNPDLMSTVINGIEQNKQQSNTLLQELSSGRRVNAYSDDPAASAAMVFNRAGSSIDDQFTRNISDLKSLLQTGDSAMSSLVNSLSQAITTGIQGANSTLSDSDRQALAAQIDGIQQNVLGLANSAVNGTYVFSGTAVTTPPFVVDSNSSSGVTYQGNGGTNNVQIGNGQSTAVNVPGTQIFSNASGNVFQSLKDLSKALSTNGNIQGAISEVRSAFNEVSKQRVFYGQALNRIDSASNAIAQDKLQLQTQENDLVGADPAQVASDLSQVQTTQTALMAAGAKVTQYTLLDFLR